MCGYCIDHWADVLLVSLYAWDEHVHKMLYHVLAYADVDADVRISKYLCGETLFHWLQPPEM